MASVRQSGGDYSSLNAATAAGETVITIEGEWTITDTDRVVITAAGTTITAVGASRHPGYVDYSQNHYRLDPTAYGDVIDVNAGSVTIDGISICLLSIAESDEAIDIQGGNFFTARNCLIYAQANPIRYQDGIYWANQSRTVTVEQCAIWNFSRAAIHQQNYVQGNFPTNTIYVNSCTIFNNGRVGEIDNIAAGGIACRLIDGGGTFGSTVYCQNSLVFGNTGAAIAEDFRGYRVGSGATLDLNLYNSLYGTAFFWATSDIVNSIEDVNFTDNPSPGVGDYIICNDLTTWPYDFRLIDSADNDAQDYHPNATGATLTIPANDVVGTARPQNTNYDVGFYEIAAGGPIGRTEQLAIDAVVLDNVQTSSTIDAVIARKESVNAAVDAVVAGRVLATTAVDAIISGAPKNSAVLDAYVGEALTETVSADALVLLARAATAAADAIVGSNPSTTASVDAIVTAAAVAPPTYISDGFGPDGYDSAVNPKLSGQFAVQAGDLIVAMASGDNGSPEITELTITSSPAETWTQEVEQPQGAGNEGYSTIWSATVSTTGNIELTCTRANTGLKFGFCWVVFRDHTGIGATLEYQPPEGPVCQAPIITQQERSAICMNISDGFARSAIANTLYEVDAGPFNSRVSWDTGNEYMTEAGTYEDSGSPAGSNEIGMTNPQDMRASMTAVEVKGTGTAIKPQTSAIVDALIKAAATPSTADVDAIISAVATNSNIIDALVEAVQNNQLDVDALIALLALSVNTNINALIQATGVTQTVNLDALITEPGMNTAQTALDALIKGARTNQNTLDALVQLGRTVVSNLDALVVALGANTAVVGVDALIQAARNITASIDAIIVTEGAAITASAVDGLVQSPESDTSAIDGVIGQAETRVASLDALISLQTSITAAVDAFIVTISGNTTLTNLDALIQFGSTVQATVDALVRADLLTSTDLDAIIIEEGVALSGALIDALVQGIEKQSSLIDAVLGERIADSITDIDAIISLGAFNQSTGIDALLELQGINQSTLIDALLQTISSASLGIDAILGLRRISTVSADAVVAIVQQSNTGLDGLILVGLFTTTNVDAFVGDLADTAMNRNRILVIDAVNLQVVILPDDYFTVL